MRILYLTQFFEPEPVPKGASFVRALIAEGHEVEVVTGYPNYPRGRLYDGYRLKLHQREVIGGVEIHRVLLYPSHSTSTAGRMLNYLSYAASSAIYGIFRAKPFDVIYVYPPPTSGLAAALIGALRRRPFVLDVQDLWPDSVVKSGMRGSRRMESALTSMLAFLYRRAGRIIAQSKGIAATLAERGVPPGKIDTIFNWADEMMARPLGTRDLRRYRFDGKFNVVYAGNLGAVQGLDTLIKAAAIAAKDVPNLQLLLIGDGMDRARLVSLRDELDATNVLIEPAVPRNEIGDVLAAADVLALHLIDDPLFEITIPQKLQFYLAMGRPVLVAVKGEAANFVSSANAGLTAEPSSERSIADAIVRLARMSPQEREQMGRRARQAYYRHFSFAHAVRQTSLSLSAAASSGASLSAADERTQ